MSRSRDLHAELLARLGRAADEVPMPAATFAAELVLVRVIGRPTVRKVVGDDLRDIDGCFVRHEGDVSDLGGRRAVGVAIPTGKGPVDRAFDEGLTRLAEVRCGQHDPSVFSGPLGEYFVTRLQRVGHEPSFGDNVPGHRATPLRVRARLATLLSFGFELPCGGFKLPHALSAAGACYTTSANRERFGVHRAVRARQVRSDAIEAFAAMAEEELAASLDVLPAGSRDLLKGMQPSVTVSTYWTHQFTALESAAEGGRRNDAFPEPTTPDADLAGWAAGKDSEYLRRFNRDPRSRPEWCRAARIELDAREERR